MGTRPRRYAVLLASAALSTGLLLTGCSGDPQPSPPPTNDDTVAAGDPTTPAPTNSSNLPTSADPTDTETNSSPTTTKPSPSQTTTEGGGGSPDEAGAPGVPKPARQHTKAGAKAFVRHFYSEFNKAMAKPKVGLLRPLSTDACGTCLNYEKAAAQSASKKQHLDGPSFRTKKMFVFPGKGGTSEVRVIHELLARKLLDAQGDVVDERQSRTIEDRLNLVWTSSGWRVTSIRTVV